MAKSQTTDELLLELITRQAEMQVMLEDQSDVISEISSKLDEIILQDLDEMDGQ